MLQSTQYDHFKRSVLFTLFLLFAVGLFLFIYGKTHSFVIINGNYNPQLDYFFQYVTFLGDGLIYIPIVFYCLAYNRKFLWPVIFGIVICTLLSQGLKRFVFPDALRPFSLEAQNVIIHKIKNVPLNRLHSFPSGHTSTAFSMALLLASVVRKKIWAYVLPLIAFLVGYSRVYLAQHFVTDVMAGMAVGIVTSICSILLYSYILNRRAKKHLDTETPEL